MSAYQGLFPGMYLLLLMANLRLTLRILGQSNNYCFVWACNGTAVKSQLCKLPHPAWYRQIIGIKLWLSWSMVHKFFQQSVGLQDCWRRRQRPCGHKICVMQNMDFLMNLCEFELFCWQSSGRDTKCVAAWSHIGGTVFKPFAFRIPYEYTRMIRK